LRFLGVGNAQAFALGSSAAVLEAEDQPWLLICCGPRTISRAAASDFRWSRDPRARLLRAPTGGSALYPARSAG